jgi:hypothetical protein
MIQKRNYSRNRGLKREELKRGVFVVMNTMADATLFVIREVNASSTMIGLQEVGTSHSIQWMDYSCCLHPNSEQLDMHKGQGTNQGEDKFFKEALDVDARIAKAWHQDYRADQPVSDARLLIDQMVASCKVEERRPEPIWIISQLNAIKSAVIALEIECNEYRREAQELANRFGHRK